MHSRTETLILGAGPAGIGAGIALGSECILVERASEVGGQSKTIRIGEAFFDIGGHSFHTHHQDVRELVYKSLEMFDQRRNAQCLTHGVLIPYPFQHHFHLIPDSEVVDKCATGLQAASQASSVSNFQEYIVARFGQGIADEFMIPYNQKLWAHDLRELDVDWVGERVAGAKAAVNSEGNARDSRKPLVSSSNVGYPARGGFGEIYKALAARLSDLRLGVTIRKIDSKSKRALTVEGDVFEYNRLISTLPLIEIVRLIDPYPAHLEADLQRLKYMSLICAMVAVDHPVDTDIQRVYCANSSTHAHKIAFNHNSSDWLRQRSHHGIVGEISYSPAKPTVKGNLLELFIEELVGCGFVRSRRNVLGGRLIDVKYGYPIPTRDRPAIVGRVMAFLTELDIHSIGRFGEWAYINSDEAISRGLKVTARIPAA